MLRQYELVEIIRAYDPDCDEALLNAAYVLVMQAGANAARVSGSPLAAHPIEVATRLATMKTASHVVAAGYMSAIPREARPSPDELMSKLGPTTAHLITRVYDLQDSVASDPDDPADAFRLVIAALLSTVAKAPARPYDERILDLVSPIARLGDREERFHNDPVFNAERKRQDYDLKVGLIDRISANYGLLHEMSPRSFEEFVAELLTQQGYMATLTKQTRDGGFDIVARRTDGFFSTTYLVECKKYAADNRVPVDVIRKL